MNKVLYIKANAKPDGASRTFQISDAFVEVYKKYNAKDEIITLDLYKAGIHELTPQDIMDVFGPKTEESKNHPILKYAYQFLEADKYIFAEPMWNLSIPAILKAYIDYICVTGITFKYTQTGPVGLCTGKKAVNITTRGGVYSQAPGADYEMGDRYLRTILGFLGIQDYAIISAESLDVIGQDVSALVHNAIEIATEKAKHF
jgi:FMN-dependent NADH-azoreductase